MTLSELLTNLTNPNIVVTLVDDETEQTIIEFKSQGVQGVEADILARPVKKWGITSALAITVTIGASNP